MSTSKTPHAFAVDVDVNEIPGVSSCDDKTLDVRTSARRRAPGVAVSHASLAQAVEATSQSRSPAEFRALPYSAWLRTVYGQSHMRALSDLMRHQAARI